MMPWTIYHLRTQYIANYAVVCSCECKTLQFPHTALAVFPIGFFFLPLYCGSCCELSPKKKTTWFMQPFASMSTLSVIRWLIQPWQAVVPGGPVTCVLPCCQMDDSGSLYVSFFSPSPRTARRQISAAPLCRFIPNR